ncbi:MAG: DNA mismatch repair protein MutS [bacterium]|nr:DNA mismatch repair protein MutS [bacterium]
MSEGKRKSGADEDAGLFAEEVSDIQPLEHGQLPPAVQAPAPISLSQREREVIRELDALVSGELPFEMEQSDEFLEGAVPGLDPQVRRRLRRGEYAAQENLDLHGSDRETARVRVEKFVASAFARGLRCVRIVHGRGRNSPGGESVLKSSLPRWLARGPARNTVLAYTSALPGDGGTGATYVLLRKNKS